MDGWEPKCVVGNLKFPTSLVTRLRGYAVTRLRGYAYVIVCLNTPVKLDLNCQFLYVKCCK